MQNVAFLFSHFKQQSNKKVYMSIQLPCCSVSKHSACYQLTKLNMEIVFKNCQPESMTFCEHYSVFAHRLLKTVSFLHHSVVYF